MLDHLGLDPQPPPRGRARDSGQELRGLSRVRLQTRSTTGCTATLRPGRLCAPWRHVAVVVRVDLEVQTHAGTCERPKTRRRDSSGSPQAQIRLLRPAADPTRSLRWALSSAFDIPMHRRRRGQGPAPRAGAAGTTPTAEHTIAGQQPPRRFSPPAPPTSASFRLCASSRRSTQLGVSTAAANAQGLAAWVVCTPLVPQRHGQTARKPGPALLPGRPRPTSEAPMRRSPSTCFLPRPPGRKIAQPRP